MKTVNYFGLELDVHNDVKVIAMDGKKQGYPIIGYISADITWDKTHKMWVGSDYIFLEYGEKSLVKPSKSKVEV
jgi:hypothetical protein